MKILFIGDSITDCARYKDQDASLGQGYVLMTAGQLMQTYPEKDIEVINKGISGNKVTDLLARFKRDCINYQPDIVSIFVGINDVWHESNRNDGVDADLFETLYEILIQLIKKHVPHAKIILMEPAALCTDAIAKDFPVIAPGLKINQTIIKKIADKHQLIHVPLQGMFEDALKIKPVTYWLYDGVHPSPVGHKMIADQWIRCAAEIFAG